MKTFCYPNELAREAPHFSLDVDDNWQIIQYPGTLMCMTSRQYGLFAPSISVSAQWMPVEISLHTIADAMSHSISQAFQSQDVTIDAATDGHFEERNGRETLTRHVAIRGDIPVDLDQLYRLIALDVNGQLATRTVFSIVATYASDESSLIYTNLLATLDSFRLT